MQVCDGGSPDRCDTQTVQVTIERNGFIPGLGASGGGCGCASADVAGSLPWYGIPALLALLRRRRRWPWPAERAER